MRPPIFLSPIADAPFRPSIGQPHESQYGDPGVLFGTKMAERLDTRFAASVLAGRSAQIASVVYDRSKLGSIRFGMLASLWLAPLQSMFIGMP
jgi:hypothetical protein